MISFHHKLIHEYFYKKLCEIDDAQTECIRAMRTKRGLIVLSDQLRALEVEKIVVMRIYEDLKVFFY